MQFNVENLFLILDLYKNQDLKKITEQEWRGLTNSITPNKSIKKVWDLANIIQDINPDIVMLNEVGGLESLENFNKFFLNSRFKTYLKEGNSLRGIDVGYLISNTLSSKALLISHKDRPLNFLYPHEVQTPAGGKSHYFSRDVAELRLFNPDENSPRLTILLTHLKSKLDSEKIDPEGKLRRAAEFNSLLEIYAELRNELGQKTPILICGDLNGLASRENTEPEFLSLYKNTDLVDVLEIAGKPLNERYTQIQILSSGKLIPMQIDYIFASQSLHKLVAKEETFVYRFKDLDGSNAPAPRSLEERSLFASDHYPLVLTLNGFFL
ncbi:MAG: hypothetical protein A2Z20_07740 [Bdellovibrionales bacterium RBG_16_40_8]|nr:MAG: hypothetical protein A2Z20_07740 [Bdellovibrionales bacterium RBG_16_40_8]